MLKPSKRYTRQFNPLDEISLLESMEQDEGVKAHEIRKKVFSIS